jgi:hypothetical protein
VAGGIFAYMKAASIQEIKQELKETSQLKVIDICLRLARHKKENKELLTYLLFEAHDIHTYIQNVKNEIDEGFDDITASALYLIKKSLRKILRIANKHIRFSGDKTAEVEILLHFSERLKNSGIQFKRNAMLLNLYNSQIKKIATAISSLHEDLQHDYLRQLNRLKE